MSFGSRMKIGMENNMLHFRKMTDKTQPIIFNYDCAICGKHMADNKYKNFPVIFKIKLEKLLVCETCLSFIKDNGEFSTFGVI